MNIDVRNANTQDGNPENQRITIDVWAHESKFVRDTMTKAVPFWAQRFERTDIHDHLQLETTNGLGQIIMLAEHLQQAVLSEQFGLAQGAPVDEVLSDLISSAFAALVYRHREDELVEPDMKIDAIEIAPGFMINIGDKVHVRASKDLYTVTGFDFARGSDFIGCESADGTMGTWAQIIDVKPESWNGDVPPSEPAFADIPIPEGGQMIDIQEALRGLGYEGAVDVQFVGSPDPEDELPEDEDEGDLFADLKASQYEVDRHAVKQGVSYSDAWRYFEKQGYDMSTVDGQYSRLDDETETDEFEDTDELLGDDEDDEL